MDPIPYYPDPTEPTDSISPTNYADPTYPTYYTACPASGYCINPACPACHPEYWHTYFTDLLDTICPTDSTGSTYPIYPTYSSYASAKPGVLIMNPAPCYTDPTDPTDPRTYPIFTTDLTDPTEFTPSAYSGWNPIVSSEPGSPPTISRRASMDSISSESTDLDDIRSRSDSISSAESSLSGCMSSNTVAIAPIITYPYPRLPTEVCEIIIEFIEDDETFRACCLTCRDWLPKSRIGLDRYTTYVSRYAKDVPGFIEYLKLRPMSAHNVLDLIVGFSLEYDWDGDHSHDELSKAQAGGLSLIAMQLPNRLPNLQELNLFDPDMTPILHPRCYITLTCFRGVHTLDFLRPVFSTYNQLFRLVAAFPNLISLKLRYLPDTVLPYGRILCRKPAIPGLRFWSGGGHLPALFRWLSPCATFLMIMDRWSSKDNQVIADYIQRCGGSLNNLWLRGERELIRPFAPGDFNSAHNTNLHELRLSCVSIRGTKRYNLLRGRPGADNGWNCDDLQSVAQMLATMSSECLEDLDVSLWLHESPLPQTVVLPDLGWDAIDSALALPNFPHARRIRIGMSTKSESNSLRYNHSSVSSASMAQLLPQLASRATALGPDFTTKWHTNPYIALFFGIPVRLSLTYLQISCRVDLNFSSSTSSSEPDSSNSKFVDSVSGWVFPL